MHVTTRVKAEVDKTPNAELLCNICLIWKPAIGFLTYTRREKQEYQTHCLICNTLGKSMRKGRKGKFPSKQEIQEALRSGGLSLVATPMLKQAKHKQRYSQPLDATELELVRKRRLQREKENTNPDMCYLVGIKGDDKFVKIGHSRDPEARLADYQSGNPRELYLIATLDGGEVKERELHQKFMMYHTDECVGEWFVKSPAIMNEFSSGRIKNAQPKV